MWERQKRAGGRSGRRGGRGRDVYTHGSLAPLGSILCSLFGLAPSPSSLVPFVSVCAQLNQWVDLEIEDAALAGARAIAQNRALNSEAEEAPVFPTPLSKARIHIEVFALI